MKALMIPMMFQWLLLRTLMFQILWREKRAFQMSQKQKWLKRYVSVGVTGNPTLAAQFKVMSLKWEIYIKYAVILQLGNTYITNTTVDVCHEFLVGFQVIHESVAIQLGVVKGIKFFHSSLAVNSPLFKNSETGD